jgi:uncharacterized membrane-anchored protein YitT (DUF2179 family)
LGVKTVGTLIFVSLNSYFINLLYPKFKKVKVSISSYKHETIVKKLKEAKFHRGYVVFQGKSGYTDNDVYTIDTVLTFLELKSFIIEIKKIDQNA